MLVVVAGWVFDVPVLKSFLSGAVEMTANAAVGLVLARLLSVHTLRSVVAVAVAISAEIGAVAYVGYLWNISDLVTEIWLPRVAINTAFAFILIGGGTFLATSLSYLWRFPVDTLKIDRSFVRDVAINADDAALTSAIIAMAPSLNLTVVAEGVETVEQASVLREHVIAHASGLRDMAHPALALATA